LPVLLRSIIAEKNACAELDRMRAVGTEAMDRESDLLGQEAFNAIKQPLQHCDKSPTQEAEPYDHRRCDQNGEEVDRGFPARGPGLG
jgi:hypothetical protein